VEFIIRVSDLDDINFAKMKWAMMLPESAIPKHIVEGVHQKIREDMAEMGAVEGEDYHIGEGFGVVEEVNELQEETRSPFSLN
jgi:hypothetical protein